MCTSGAHHVKHFPHRDNRTDRIEYFSYFKPTPSYLATVLVIAHNFRVTFAFELRMVIVVILSKLSLFLYTLAANPARMYIAVAKLIQKPTS